MEVEKLKIIPRADFKENWVRINPVLEKDELALIFTDSGTPSMVVGDGKTPAIKCRNISPFAFIEIVKNESTNTTILYLRKSQDDYKLIKQTIEKRNKSKESAE